MAYAPVNWEDDVTPVDEVHLGQMDQGIALIDARVDQVESLFQNKLDVHSETPAGDTLLSTSYALGEQQAFAVRGDGIIRWGPGGAAAFDTLLNRIGPGQLSISDSLQASTLSAAQILLNGVPLEAVDISGKLDTRSIMGATGHVFENRLAAGNPWPAFQFDGNGKLVWGPGGSTPSDTVLYRNGAGVLRSDGTIDANALTINGVPVGTGGGGLPADTVVVAATRIIANKLLAGHAQPAWRVFGDGKQEWGAGGASALDVSLYRWYATALKTGGSFFASGDLTSHTDDMGTITLASDATIYFGGDMDTILKRQAAGVLRTDGTLDANALTINGVPVGSGGGAALPADTVVVAATRIISNKLLAGDAQPAWRVLGSGKQEWGAGGATALDTNLYRSAADTLKTDDTFLAVGNVYGNYDSSYRVTIGYDFVSGLPGIGFGNPTDTSLYRSAAGQLKTDGILMAGSSVQALAGQVYSFGANDAGGFAAYISGDTYPRFRASNSGSIQWGPGGAVSADTNLYRAAAGNLRTDGAMTAVGYLAAAINTAQEVVLGNVIGNSQPGIYFKSDTNLYRSAAAVLKTDGYFYAGNAIYANHSAATQVGLTAYQGDKAAVDLAGEVLYRKSAGNLEASGTIWSGPAGALVSGSGTVYLGGTLDLSLGRTAGMSPWGPGLFVGTHLYAGADLIARQNTAYATQIGHVNGYAGIYFGNPQDTSLLRLAADTLHTPGSLYSKTWGYTGAGADIAAAGGIIQITNGLHRITATDGATITTISGPSRSIVFLFNYTGVTLNFNTVGIAWSIPNLATRMVVHNVYNGWHPITLT